jgi:hypothetical protein
MQSFPLIEGNTYEYTEEEFEAVKQALRDKTKHWEYEEYDYEEPVYEEQTIDEAVESMYGVPITVPKTVLVQTGTTTVKKTRGVLKDYTPPAKTDEELKVEYNVLTVQYIREKYTADDENKILREKLAGTDYGTFEVYNAYVEECKAKAHLEVYGV